MLSEEISDEDIAAATEEMGELVPKLSMKCPSNPYINTTFATSEKPTQSISPYFLFYSSKRLNKGYELSLRGEHIYKKMGRRIEDKDLPTILTHIKGEGDIVSLDLSNNIITDEGFDILCEFLLHSNLINLNLHSNELKNLSEEGFEKLATTCLKRLTLSGNHLSAQTARSLELMLKLSKSLEVLELAGVDFYTNSVHRIIDVLLEYNNTLKVLNISRLLGILNYRVRSYYLADVIYALLVQSNTLVELHLEKNSLTDHDMEKIVKALKFNQTLLVLNLTANFINNIGVERIATILPESNLKVLLLRSNSIGDHGAIALSKTMPLSRILHLDISYNRIEDIGLANLLWTIKKPTPLYTFYIFGNKITKQTLEIVHVQMLRGKIIPESLDIILYWEEDGSIRCSHNPDAEEYRKQMAGLYEGGHVPTKPNILNYPVIDVFQSYILLDRNIKYPNASNPKVLSYYKEHIAVK